MDGSVFVAIGTENGTSSSNLQEILGIKIESLPQIRFTWQKLDGFRKYIFDERATIENLEYFVDRLSKNMIKPYVLS
jgi:hypothetical protein